MFAATPPLAAKKILVSLAGSQPESNDQLKLMFVDVKRSYFYATVSEPIYVKLPPGDYEKGMAGKLNKALYGTRAAAVSWEKKDLQGAPREHWMENASRAQRA